MAGSRLAPDTGDVTPGCPCSQGHTAGTGVKPLSHPSPSSQPWSWCQEGDKAAPRWIPAWSALAQAPWSLAHVNVDNSPAGDKLLLYTESPLPHLNGGCRIQLTAGTKQGGGGGGIKAI